MDGFLDFLGLYRSDVAKDGTCLFRAFCEQVFYTQRYHEETRINCIEFMQKNKKLFEQLVENFDEYLEGLRNFQKWAGPVEMIALSLQYKIDFIVYSEIGKPPLTISVHGSTPPLGTVLLAGFTNHRYDSVYTKPYLAVSAICQSLTYEILYKKVFGLGDDVDIAVDRMLHDKSYSKQRKSSISASSRESDGASKEDSENIECEQDVRDDIKKALAQGIPPFPYKVAKTLDPNIYRNVEFDIWNEREKESLKNDEYVTPSLIPGVKCNVKVSEGDKELMYTAHVQEIENQGQVTVYIEKLCKKCVVPKEDIELIPIPAYKALTWQGGKTYRVFADFARACDRRSKKKNRRYQDNHNSSTDEETSRIPFSSGGITPNTPRSSRNESGFADMSPDSKNSYNNSRSSGPRKAYHSKVPLPLVLDNSTSQASFQTSQVCQRKERVHSLPLPIPRNSGAEGNFNNRVSKIPRYVQLDAQNLYEAECIENVSPTYEYADEAIAQVPIEGYASPYYESYNGPPLSTMHFPVEYASEIPMNEVHNYPSHHQLPTYDEAIMYSPMTPPQLSVLPHSYPPKYVPMYQSQPIPTAMQDVQGILTPPNTGPMQWIPTTPVSQFCSQTAGFAISYQTSISGAYHPYAMISPPWSPQTGMTMPPPAHPQMVSYPAMMAPIPQAPPNFHPEA